MVGANNQKPLPTGFRYAARPLRRSREAAAWVQRMARSFGCDRVPGIGRRQEF